jgi:hypothetical protein
MSSYLAAIYVISKICIYYHISSGKAILFCDNKGAISKAFKTPQMGITPFLTTDFDLLHQIQQ